MDYQYRNCIRNACSVPILRLSGPEEHEHIQGRPALFVSGAFHGDERLGPVITLETARFLIENYSTSPYINWLVNHRDFWLAPFVNAYGYASNRRVSYNSD